MQSETHGGDDVAAYARGSAASTVRGVMEQNELYDVMYRALFGKRSR
jgi:alkaline phosphatase